MSNTEKIVQLTNTATGSNVLFQRPGRSEERIYERTDKFPNLSEKSLLASLDLIFPSYLEAVVSQEDEQMGPEAAAWWMTTHAERPLSKIVEESITLSDSPTQPLTPQELITRLEEWKCFINSHQSTELLDDSDVLHFNTGTLLDLCYCRAFNQPEEEIPGCGKYVPERFFSYLIEQVFFNDRGPSPESVIQRERLTVALEFRNLLKSIIHLTAAVDLEETQERRSIIHHALKGILTITDTERQRSFLERIESIVGDALPDTVGEILSTYSGVLRELLKEEWEESIIQELGRVVVLGEQDILEEMQRSIIRKEGNVIEIAPSLRPIFEIVPGTNFYFLPDLIKPISSHDREMLPPMQKMISSHDPTDFVGGVRDGSLFDSAGNKVWWGDLAESDIKNLHGPLYLLSQQDSYHNVPDWVALTDRETTPTPEQIAFLATMLEEDTHFKNETMTLNCAYVRLKAVGKIVGGVFIPNPKIIELPE